MMKFLFLLSIVACATTVASAQDSNRNYVVKRKMLSASTVEGQESSNHLDVVQYYDGFGRPTVNIVKNGSLIRSCDDIVTLTEYSSENRIAKMYLPGIKSQAHNGAYVDDVSTLSFSLYGTDSRYFTENTYENSPYDRIVSQMGPGENWEKMGKAVSTEWHVNCSTTELSVRIYKLCPDDISITSDGLYPSGSLTAVKGTDEDGNVTIEFTNGLGQKMLSRKRCLGTNVDTYFIYDDWGNLRYVLPPAASNALTNGTWNLSNCETLQKYAYYYRYNRRRECIEKKLPGAETVKMVYDKAGHLVFLQEGNQRKTNSWTFNLYDQLGRPTVTGICQSVSVIAPANPITSSYSLSGELAGYSSQLSLNVTQLLKVNYYDDYAFLNSESSQNQTDLAYGYASTYGQQFAGSKGMLTGSRIYELGNENYTLTASYYDKLGRMVQSRATNHLNGTETNYFSYAFTGNVLQHKHQHTAQSKQPIIEETKCEYDRLGRLTNISHRINNGTEMQLCNNSYDALGRMSTHSVNGNPTSYSYNIRGWLTDISGEEFKEQLTYESATNGVTPAKPSYSGNISAIQWRVPAEGMTHGYAFGYDELGRLTQASYGSGTERNGEIGRYNEAATYDLMGNITSLQRYGMQDDDTFGLIDDLAYSYDGNQLVRVDDAVSGPFYSGAFHFRDGIKAANEYAYDENGNQTKDLNKNFSSIQYNCLNLQSLVCHKNGSSERIVYDAAGRKLRTIFGIQAMTQLNPRYSVMEKILSTFTTLKNDSATTIRHFVPVRSVKTLLPSLSNVLQVSNSGSLTLGKSISMVLQESAKQTDYCGNVIYNTDKTVAVLNDYGYVLLNDSGTATYYYEAKDHLGNVRVVYNQSGKVEQINHYYPFGALTGKSTNGSVQPYKYNGKELDRENGLDLYDYGARYYDAAIGRFTSMDPLCEKYYNISPYAYCAGNPINSIDPDGKLVIFINGMYFNPSEGGTSKYWNGLDSRISNRFHDHHLRYYDGASGGVFNTITHGLLNGNLNPELRKYHGHIVGFNQAQSIISSLKSDETIKIVSHSMGSAYAKGFIEGILKYADRNGIDIKGRIKFELDLAPFQPYCQSAVKNVTTEVIAHEYDNTAGSSPIENATNYVTRTENGYKTYDLTKEHSVDSFTQEEIRRFVPELDPKNAGRNAIWEENGKYKQK